MMGERPSELLFRLVDRSITTVDVIEAAAGVVEDGGVPGKLCRGKGPTFISPACPLGISDWCGLLSRLVIGCQFDHWHVDGPL